MHERQIEQEILHTVIAQRLRFTEILRKGWENSVLLYRDSLVHQFYWFRGPPQIVSLNPLVRVKWDLFRAQECLRGVEERVVEKQWCRVKRQSSGNVVQFTCLIPKDHSFFVVLPFEP